MSIGISVSPPLEGSSVAESGIAAPRFQSPLTIRGLVVAVFAGYLLAFPVIRETDIVAAVFATTILLLLLAIAALTLWSSARLRREFRVSFSPPSSGGAAAGGSETILSGRPIGCLLKLSPVSVWPLFVLTVEILFEGEDLEISLHRITGRFNETIFLPQPVTFPHRGRWQLRGIRLSYGDQFGLSVRRWSLVGDAARAAVTVHPPIHRGEALPVITSCQRSGDLITDVLDRRGDLFDLKPYHPSDGMRRIVWKIFARRGELIARQPEASMTPEGQVVVYTLAEKDEDGVCGAALGYIEQLEELGIEIFCGVEGMEERPPARTRGNAEELFIDTAWSPRDNEGAWAGEVDRLIERVKSTIGPNSAVDRVLIFCSVDRLCDERTGARCEALARHLAAQQIHPAFFIYDGHPFASSLERVTRPGWFMRAVYTPRAETTPPPDRRPYNEFLARCARANWHVVPIVEGAW